ncbi:MAG: aminotransferase class V-fold PLP-dependent enzyme, partial [Nanoarchaeota archaeon]
MNERIFAQVRQQFPLLQRTVNGKRLVYLDSAATSQKPVSVLDAERTFYQTLNANVHRGVHTLSVKATEAYENARATVAKFINTDTDQIVFVRNATEAINLVARTWARQNVKNGDMIVLTQAEHHSNIVPWQELAKEAGARIGYVRVDENGVLRQDDLAELLQHKPKLFAFTHVSNVLGTINPAKDMIRKAHAAGALVLLDAAQSVPHMAVDVDDLDCDFMVFSGHKMLGPMGIGVLYGRKK